MINRHYLRAVAILLAFLFCSVSLQSLEVKNRSIRGLKKKIQVKLIDSKTKKTLTDALMFIVEKKTTGYSEGNCRIYKKLSQSETFIYKINKPIEKLEFWFLSPGYKSVKTYYSKTRELIPGIPPELSLFFHTSEVYTDLDGEVTIIEMQYIKNDSELMKTELTVGLLALKKIVEGTAFTILHKFINQEYKSIKEQQSVEKNQ